MLKQLKLQTELKQRKLELEELQKRQADFKTRQAKLETALNEAEKDEDVELVNSQVEELEKEVKEANVDEKISKVEEEIERINGELADIDERSKKPKAEQPKQTEKRGKEMNRYQVRELLRTGEYYERAEVKEFYDKFKNLRAVTGGTLTIPDIVINRIMDILGDYSTLYPLVNKIQVKGTARILVDTDTTAATWIEQNGTIADGDVGTITNVDFDGWKVGKVTFVDNSMLQDSIVNLDDYVVKKLARSISLALDLAILNGTGAAGKQPEGIIPAIPEANKVTVADPTIADIVKNVGLIDTGADSIGEIVVVMKRSTYYNRFVQFTVQTNSNGDVVGTLPNLKNPDLLGLRVVFNNNMDEDKVLFGDFDKYTLVERENITIDKSEHVKFAEDQMAFRGKGRFDGKPTKPEAFALVTLEYTPEA